MESRYNLKEITPTALACGLGACPAVYEVTPKHLRCGVGPCPGIFDDGKTKYLIIGEKVDPKEFGLENKVGENETLIQISKEIIDQIGK